MKSKKRVSARDMIARWAVSDPDQHPAYSREEIAKQILSLPPLEAVRLGVELFIYGGKEAISELEYYVEEIEEARAKQE